MRCESSPSGSCWRCLKVLRSVTSCVLSRARRLESRNNVPKSVATIRFCRSLCARDCVKLELELAVDGLQLLVDRLQLLLAGLHEEEVRILRESMERADEIASRYAEAGQAR
jgi:hypothetical protein